MLSTFCHLNFSLIFYTHTHTQAVNYIGVPRYLEEAVLNEGSIDLSNVDEAKVEQNELFAYISKHSLKPPPTTTTTAAATTGSNSSTLQSYYNASNLNETYPYINNIIVTSTPATSSSTAANGTSSSVSSATTSPGTSPTAGSSPLRFCPLRFDGYLCWPRTPAGSVLSQYCPDFVEGFNRKFLAHKTWVQYNNRKLKIENQQWVLLSVLGWALRVEALCLKQIFA